MRVIFDSSSKEADLVDFVHISASDDRCQVLINTKYRWLPFRSRRDLESDLVPMCASTGIRQEHQVFILGGYDHEDWEGGEQIVILLPEDDREFEFLKWEMFMSQEKDQLKIVFLKDAKCKEIGVFRNTDTVDML